MAKEVKVVVSADAGKFQRGMSDAEKATSKLHSALDRFGPLGKGAANILDKLGFSSVGAAVGVPFAYGLSRLLKAQLYGFNGLDVGTAFAAIVALWFDA